MEKELLVKLQNAVELLESFGQYMDVTDWWQQEGVLITGNEALLLIDILKEKLDETKKL